MDLEPCASLRYFMAVAEHLNFGRAAERACTSPSPCCSRQNPRPSRDELKVQAVSPGTSAATGPYPGR